MFVSIPWKIISLIEDANIYRFVEPELEIMDIILTEVYIQKHTFDLDIIKYKIEDILTKNNLTDKLRNMLNYDVDDIIKNTNIKEISENTYIKIIKREPAYLVLFDGKNTILIVKILNNI